MKQLELKLKGFYEEMPAGVLLKDGLDNDGSVCRLKRKKNHLVDLIKMVAYQAEADFLSLIRSIMRGSMTKARSSSNRSSDEKGKYLAPLILN